MLLLDELEELILADCSRRTGPQEDCLRHARWPLRLQDDAFQTLYGAGDLSAGHKCRANGTKMPKLSSLPRRRRSIFVRFRRALETA